MAIPGAPPLMMELLVDQAVIAPPSRRGQNSVASFTVAIVAWFLWLTICDWSVSNAKKACRSQFIRRARYGGNRVERDRCRDLGGHRHHWHRKTSEQNELANPRLRGLCQTMTWMIPATLAGHPSEIFASRGYSDLASIITIPCSAALSKSWRWMRYVFPL